MILLILCGLLTTFALLTAVTATGLPSIIFALLVAVACVCCYPGLVTRYLDNRIRKAKSLSRS